MLEVAKAYGRGQCKFYDEEEYKGIVELYGLILGKQSLGDG